MSDPFASAGAAGTKITDYEGQLLLLRPTEYITGMKTEYSDDKDAVVAEVTVLDGPGAPEDLGEVYVFQGGLIGQLKNKIGKTPDLVLGRLGKGEAKKKGFSAPWKFLTPNEDDKQVARDYLAKQKPKDPFDAS